MAVEEGGAVAPDGVGCVGFYYLGGGLGVPEFLGGFNFLVGGCEGKGGFDGGHCCAKAREGRERGDEEDGCLIGWRCSILYLGVDVCKVAC